MKILVLYDSFFGNTEQIARAVGAAFDPQACAGVVRISEARPEMLQGVDLLFVGSPTRGFQASQGTRAFLNKLPANALTGIRAAAFDTRIRVEDTNSGFLKFMVKIFGYAAPSIAGMLKKKGARPAGEPEGFYVKESEGPLHEGELERAGGWAKSCAQTA